MASRDCGGDRYSEFVIFSASLAHPTRLELVTCGLEDRCSIRLSYRCVSEANTPNHASLTCSFTVRIWSVINLAATMLGSTATAKRFGSLCALPIPASPKPGLVNSKKNNASIATGKPIAETQR